MLDRPVRSTVVAEITSHTDDEPEAQASRLSSQTNEMSAELPPEPKKASAENHLPTLELAQAPGTRPISRSAADLGGPIEGRVGQGAFTPRRIDPSKISFNIGTQNSPPYYERYSGGLSVTVAKITSTNPEVDSSYSVSAGVSAGYSNPYTNVQVYAQPVGSVEQYGIRFSTNF